MRRAGLRFVEMGAAQKGHAADQAGTPGGEGSSITPHGWVPARDGRVPLWRFGRGRPRAVFLPGLEEGLLAGYGLRLALRWLTRTLLGDLPVVVLGRRESIPPDYTTRQMASDTAAALRLLGMGRLPVVGLGAGGLVARWVAEEGPDSCCGLVLLGLSSHGEPSPLMVQFFDHLGYLARHAGWEAALNHVLSTSLSDELRGRLGWRLGLVARLGRPPSVDRLVRQLAAFARHPVPQAPYPVPTLVVAPAHDPLLLPGRLPGPLGSPPPMPAMPPPQHHHPNRYVWLAGDQGAMLDPGGTVAVEVRRFLEGLRRVPAPEPPARAGAAPSRTPA